MVLSAPATPAAPASPAATASTTGATPLPERPENRLPSLAHGPSAATIIAAAAANTALADVVGTEKSAEPSQAVGGASSTSPAGAGGAPASPSTGAANTATAATAASPNAEAANTATAASSGSDASSPARGATAPPAPVTPAKSLMPGGRKRAIQKVSTVADRQRVVQWMAVEAASSPTAIVSRAVKHFPELLPSTSQTATKASMQKVSRWWRASGRGASLPEPMRAGAKVSVRGRGRKTAAWVLRLYGDCLEEVRKRGNAGQVEDVKLEDVRAIAGDVLKIGRPGVYGEGMTVPGKEGEMMESRIGKVWCQRFCDYYGIGVEKATGKLIMPEDRSVGGETEGKAGDLLEMARRSAMGERGAAAAERGVVKRARWSCAPVAVDGLEELQRSTDIVSKALPLFVRVADNRDACAEFCEANWNAIERFSDLLRTLAGLLGVVEDKVAMVYAADGETIAFNRGGKLHFSVAQYVELRHGDTGTVPRSEIWMFWYMKMCHCLAHNLIAAHGERHGFYTETIAAEGFSKFMAALIGG